jgi:hypothetical protein
MKLKMLGLIIIMSLMIISCASLAPVAIEDGDEGTILIIDSSKVLQVVENWGLKNGFQYVAYRRLQGGTGSSSEWSAGATQYGAYGSSRTQYTSRVLVIGIDDPKDAPEKFNVATVPPTIHQEMTEGGAYLLGTGIGLGIVGLVCLIIF